MVSFPETEDSMKSLLPLGIKRQETEIELLEPSVSYNVSDRTSQ